MIRRIVESISRNWCYQRTLSVASTRVPIYVSPSAGLRYLLKPISRADPALVALAEDFVKPGQVVWDIGANVGLFTFAAAAVAGPMGTVCAFEPDAWLVQVLRRSSARQPSSSAPVTVVPAAIASETAIRSFVLATRSRSSNHLFEYGLSQTGGTRETHAVIAVTLDWALGFLPPPNVVKIDIEGAEMEALRGAEQLLIKHRPAILCEVDASASAEVTDFFVTRGYHLIDGTTRQAVKVAPWSTIALPPD